MQQRILTDYADRATEKKELDPHRSAAAFVWPTTKGQGPTTHSQRPTTLFLPRICPRVCRHWRIRIQTWVVDRRTGDHLQRNHSRPGGERVVFFVVNRRALPHLRREFLYREAHHESLLEFFLVGLT